ncbi:LysM peptidoglycan-binding domain-containing protein [Candidatus Fermentibacteria bacterium]|nr:LysM peptidoglycan-binding domain-containing protein [Candidatus Fermentibacteria bacterium]
MHRSPCGIHLLLLAFVAGAAAGTGTYVAGYGDTLSDIALRFYGNADYWDEILAANSFLPAPEALMPGMVLVLPDIAGATVSNGTSYYETASIVEAPTFAASIPMISRLRLETAGYVAPSAVPVRGFVLGVNVEEQGIPANDDAYVGDMIEIDLGSVDLVGPGDFFSIIELGETVADQETGRDAGRVVRIAGICRVLDSTESTSVAVLDQSYLPVHAGDAIVDYVSYEPVQVNNQPVVESVDAWVLALQDEDFDNSYAYDVVYLNIGSEDGIRAGDVFQAWKYGANVTNPSNESVQTADIPISEVVVLSTEAASSAALVTANITGDLIQAGDRLHLARRQVTGSGNR